MKKTMLSILLAAQLVVSLAATGFAATDQVTYHIGSISPVGYLLDDDTRIRPAGPRGSGMVKPSTFLCSTIRLPPERARNSFSPARRV